VAASHDSAVQELTRARLTLREDLVFTPQEYRGEMFYHVEDAARSKFYRLGFAEYTFVSLLDGRTTVADALALSARVLGEEAPCEADAIRIATWLIDTGLAHTDQSTQAARLHRAARSAERRRTGERLNPLFLRIPLFNPDRLLGRVLPWLGWMFSGPAFLVWLAVCAWGASQVIADWNRFVGASAGILAPSNWIWLGASWLLLKVLHESSHALVCKRHGGSVREVGAIFVLFAPMAYVDVTSSWRFRSKWQRMHTAAAGMYGELFAAAVAAILWSRTEPGVFNHLCHHLVLTAGVATIVFNANPLMRFDGYYLLADFLELPNLYANGTGYVHYLVRRHVLGLSASATWTPGGIDWFVRCYGVASWCWRIAVYACLVVAASTLFHGAGLVLAVLSVLAWMGKPVVAFLRGLLRGDFGERPNPVRLMLAGGVTVVIAAAAFWGISWPALHSAPAFVENSPLAVLRADSAGFVRQVLVRSGQRVEENQIVAVLENEELQLEVRDLELALEDSFARTRTHLQKREAAAAQVEAKKQEALQKRLAERRRQLEKLTVRSPLAGQVLSRNLAALVGTYLTAGTEILAIGDEQQKELRVSVGQEEIDAFTAEVDEPVQVRLRGRATFSGRLVRLMPRASVKPSHASLCAPFGGPLAVKPRDRSDAANAGNNPLEEYELLEPRFIAVVSLSAEDGRRLQSGESGNVTLAAAPDSFGRGLYNLLSAWLQNQLVKSRR
jgi:putative peptide zinc metalloprotease protein